MSQIGSSAVARAVEAITPYKALIGRAAIRFNVDASILAGLIMQESGGNAFATRFEPHIKERVLRQQALPSPNPAIWAKRAGWSADDLATSWGLTQVLGITAWDSLRTSMRELKIVKPRDMLVPTNSVFLGSHYLRWQYVQFFGSDLKPPRIARQMSQEYKYDIPTIFAIISYNGGLGAGRLAASRNDWDIPRLLAPVAHTHKVLRFARALAHMFQGNLRIWDTT